MDNDYFITGYPSEIARNESIKILKYYIESINSNNVTNNGNKYLEDTEIDDINDIIQVLSDIQIQDDGLIENTPLWWYRKLTNMLNYKPPIYIDCNIDENCKYINEKYEIESNPLLLCNHTINRNIKLPTPFINIDNNDDNKDENIVKHVKMHDEWNDEIWDLDLAYKPRIERLNDMIVELDRISFWGFDIFRVASATKGWPLVNIGYALFSYYDLFNRLGLSPKILVNFLLHIEHGCNVGNNPFHNSLHVADMLQACHVFMYQLRLLGNLSDFDVLAVFLAAIIHDYRHAGLTNQYLIASQDSVAIIFNDIRLVENFAVSSAFRLLGSPEHDCDLLTVFEPIVRQKIRQQVIALVFCTNVSDHFFFLESAKALLLNTATKSVPSFRPEQNSRDFVTSIITSPPLIASIDFVSKADPRADCLLKLVMKAADVSQSVRSWDLYSRWSQLTMEEYYLQGDLEKEDSLPISKFMNRNTPNEALCHESHVRDIVRPVFALLFEVAGIEIDAPRHLELSLMSPNMKKGKRSNIDSAALDDCLRVALSNIDTSLERWDEAISLERNFEKKTIYTVN